jgi:hypothetical protein
VRQNELSMRAAFLYFGSNSTWKMPFAVSTCLSEMRWTKKYALSVFRRCTSVPLALKARSSQAKVRSQARLLVGVTVVRDTLPIHLFLSKLVAPPNTSERFEFEMVPTQVDVAVTSLRARRSALYIHRIGARERALPFSKFHF